MFARLPPSSSDLAERKSVVPPSPPADRRREHRESAAVVDARAGPSAAVLRRSEPTCSSSVSDDKVGGFMARSAASGSEQQTKETTPPLPSTPCAGARFPTLAAGFFSCSRIALGLIARSARGDLRWVAAVVDARSSGRSGQVKRLRIRLVIIGAYWPLTPCLGRV